MNATAEYRSATPRPVWMAARAQNAMRRPVFIAAISLGTFVVALVAMIVMPRQAQRAARAIAPTAAEWPDTLPFSTAEAVAQARLAAADSALTSARSRAGLLAEAIVDTTGPETRAVRAQLQAAVAELDRLIERAENAPLPASYRALAESPHIAAIPRVRELLDSLTLVERDREGFGAVAGVDPVFVALTSRATEIGRAIQQIAAARRAILDEQVRALTPLVITPTREQLAAADTVARLNDVATARAQLDTARAELAAMRARIAGLQEREARARRILAFEAPPFALLAAAVVLGIVLGFGSSLIAELRRPRIATAAEAEWVAGVRVLSVIRPRPRLPERSRRKADLSAPSHLDPRNDDHQLTYLHATAENPSLLLMLMTGDDPAVTGAVAMNFAAIAAEEAKTVLLVDTDGVNNPVASVLQARARPGFADVVGGRAGWAEATVAVPVGRERSIDFVPAGVSATATDAAGVLDTFRRDGERLLRRYDGVVIAAMRAHVLAGLPTVLPGADVIYCARIGETRLGEIRTAMKDVIEAGGRPVGVVLWDGEPPALTPASELGGAPPRARAAERHATAPA